ncbi:hypothetical protein [Hymenobacter jeollabukensis]|nr:hypothetical protein [Hymenobacter jeollabukensis]
MSTSFEDLDGWVPAPPSWLSDEKAHSGRYSCRMTGGDEYTMQFNRSWKDLGSPRKLRLNAWALLPHGRLKLNLVVSVSRNDSTLYWNSISLPGVIKHYNQWVPVHKLLVLPAGLVPTDKVTMYLWKSGGMVDAIYLDDLRLDKLS